MLGVPPLSLERAAHRQLRRRGLLVASELTRYRTLREAVGTVLAPADVEGTTRAVTATVREVLRAGLKDERIAGTPAARARQVLELTASYRRSLLERKLVDPAEAQ